MVEPCTYHDDGGDELEPESKQLVCQYYLEAGIENTEFTSQYIGPSVCGGFDVLWEESDLTEEIPVAVAWLPRAQMDGFELWQALALAYWNVKKVGEMWDNYECIEIVDNPAAVIEVEAFRAVLAAVWPADESDSDAAA